MRRTKGITRKITPIIANRQIGVKSQLGTGVDATTREMILEAMAAMLGHHPPKYTTTAATATGATATRAYQMALAITLLHTGSDQIFFSTVKEPSVTPDGLRIELAYHIFRH
jgi:hypothetical protein